MNINYWETLEYKSNLAIDNIINELRDQTKTIDDVFILIRDIQDNYLTEKYDAGVIEKETEYKVVEEVVKITSLTEDQVWNIRDKYCDLSFHERLFAEDGSFKPSVEKEKGTVTIQYLEELCEWLYYGELEDKDKLVQILKIEKIIQRLLTDFNGMDINFIPTWSEKHKKII